MHGSLRIAMLTAELHHRPDRKQTDEQDARPDAGQKEPSKRLLGRHGIKDHRDGRGQEDSQRSTRGDNPGCKTRRVPALAHFRDPGAADRGAGGRARAGHCREQRAGKDIGNAKAARNLAEPDVERTIEILSCPGSSNGRALEDEERYREQRDARHLLINVLCHRVE